MKSIVQTNFEIMIILNALVDEYPLSLNIYLCDYESGGASRSTNAIAASRGGLVACSRLQRHRPGEDLLPGRRLPMQ